MESLKIYCDESGYTGRDLLSNEQPHFVYAACHLEDDLLEEIKTLINGHRAQSIGEVKGIQFANSTKGQKAIIELFEKYATHFRVVYHEKHYALACKIVEHGIEPMLKSNVQFYTSKLSEFLASVLYISFITKKDGMVDTFTKFLEIFRGRRSFLQGELFDLTSGHPILNWIDQITQFDPQLLQDEIEQKQGEVGKEILDLTVTSLLGLLTEWGKHGHSLSVLCDDCNIFRNNVAVNFINRMGDGKRREFLSTQIGYKLTHDLRLGDSKAFYGLQIADIVSSSVCFAINNYQKDFSKKLIEIVDENCLCKPHNFSVTSSLKSKFVSFEPKLGEYDQLMVMMIKELELRYTKR